MKKFICFAALAAIFLSGCSGTVDPGTDTGSGAGDLEGSITLYVDNDIIIADGKYAANLTVLLMDRSGVEHDVTSDVEIFREDSDSPLADPAFMTSSEGTYSFYAVRGFDISNTVTVKAVTGVPALPEDTDPSAVDFSHRMLLVQHTGNECPNCPALMETLKTLAGDEAYNQRYLHVASHSYNSSDKAYSSAAQTLSKNFNVHNYPWLTYNLTAENGYYLNDIKSAIDTYHKDAAEAGVCVAARQVGSSIYAQVGLKAATAGKYRVAVWLLEDNIRSIQSGANASWQNMHDNCLREMFGDPDRKSERIYGKPLGHLEAGQASDFIVALDLEPDWVAENCKLLIIAVEGGGDYNLVNCTVCPVGGSVSYDYLK